MYYNMQIRTIDPYKLAPVLQQADYFIFVVGIIVQKVAIGSYFR